MKNKKNSPLVSINWIDETDRCIVVPGTVKEGGKLRLKELAVSKNNCYFAAGVPKGTINFIYRSVKKLKLGDVKIFFSRGMVRSGNRVVKYSVSLRRLDWDVGILMIIPRLLRHKEHIVLMIENRDYSIRIMDLIVLNGLLRISFPGKGAPYYSALSTLILARGWSQLDLKEFPEIYRKTRMQAGASDKDL